MLIEHLDGKQTVFYQKDERVIDLGHFSQLALGILHFARRMEWFSDKSFILFLLINLIRLEKINEALFAKLLENFTENWKEIIWSTIAQH